MIMGLVRRFLAWLERSLADEPDRCDAYTATQRCLLPLGHDGRHKRRGRTPPEPWDIEGADR